ncbi:MAG: hypothetical protein ABSG95_04650 [Solirubrobacteraceae bacterium]|jgi:hypothetical protein
MRAVNLIPADQRGGMGRSGAGAYAVLALLAGLALLALLYGTARHEISSRRAQAAVLASRVQQAEAAAAKLAPYTSFLALREQRLQEVAQLVDSRFDWAHSLHEFGRVLPPGVSLSTLTGTVGAASATGSPASAGSPSSSTASPAASASTAVASATPPGSLPTFTVSGCATSQSQVALTLDRMRLIDGSREVTLQSSTKTGSAGGAGGSGSGGCASGDASFTILVSFAPLPSTSAVSSSSTAADTTAKVTFGGSSSTTTPTGGAR